MSELKGEIYKAVLTDYKIQANIMLEKNVSNSTVRRWALFKSDKLLEMPILQIIARALKIHNINELF